MENFKFKISGTEILKICMESQKSPKSNLEEEKQSCGNQTPTLQTILKSYSHQKIMVLAQKYRVIGQDRNSRNKAHTQS